MSAAGRRLGSKMHRVSAKGHLRNCLKKDGSARLGGSNSLGPCAPRFGGIRCSPG